MRKQKFFELIGEGAEWGSWYGWQRGCCYRDWRTFRAYVAPIPFNWIIGGARWAWYFVIRGPFCLQNERWANEVDRHRAEAMLEGYRKGKAGEQLTFETQKGDRVHLMSYAELLEKAAPGSIHASPFEGANWSNAFFLDAKGDIRELRPHREPHQT
jgi:hypothetical protein